MKASVTLPSSSLGPLYSSSMAAKRGPPRNPPRQLVTQGDNGDKLGCSQAPRGPPEDPKTLLVTLAGTPRPPQGPRGSLKTLQDPPPAVPQGSHWNPEPQPGTPKPPPGPFQVILRFCQGSSRGSAPPKILMGALSLQWGLSKGLQDPQGDPRPLLGPFRAPHNPCGDPEPSVGARTTPMRPPQPSETP